SPPLHNDVAAGLSLAGRVALVTGSSRGIGSAIALYLAGLGADVHLHARGPSPQLDATRGAIGERGRGGRNFFADLTEGDACTRLVEESWSAGPIDIWVNNAGADVLTGEAGHLPFDKKLDQLW